MANLLEVVTLATERTAPLFALLGRTPEAVQRARLAERLLAERFRFSDCRRPALDLTLRSIQQGKSATPFNLTDDAFNQDLLAVLAALDELCAETANRVFSVRVFNDSKRFEDLSSALVRLARGAQWEPQCCANSIWWPTRAISTCPVRGNWWTMLGCFYPCPSFNPP